MFEHTVEITGYKERLCYDCNSFHRCPFVADIDLLEYDDNAESYIRDDKCVAAEVAHKNAITMGIDNDNR